MKPLDEHLALLREGEPQEVTPQIEGLVDKIAGSLMGGAVADALGWPTEFLKTEDSLKRILKVDRVEDFIPWEKRTGGRFNTYIDYIHPGEYSDDTQLTLSTARCITADGAFDADKFAKLELGPWLAYARGAGGTVTRAAQAIGRKGASWDNNFFSFVSRGRASRYTNAGANGAAMRVAPHALANAKDEQRALKGAFQNAITTHGHPRALWGALLYTKALLVLLDWGGGDLKAFSGAIGSFAEELDVSELDPPHSWLLRWEREGGRPFSSAFRETRDEVLSALDIVEKSRESGLQDTYQALGCFAPATKGSGVGTVCAALSVFLKYGGDYKRAVLSAVNILGSDTDTIGAMVGSMVGVLKGQMGVPDVFVNRLQDYGYFLRASEALARISARLAQDNDLKVSGAREKGEKADREITALAKARTLYRGQRVSHPVLGLGWV